MNFLKLVLKSVSQSCNVHILLVIISAENHDLVSFLKLIHESIMCSDLIDHVPSPLHPDFEDSIIV